MQQIEDYKRELLDIFFKQRLVIFWITLFIFVCAILIAFFWPPTYSATGLILVRAIKAEKSPEALEKEALRSFPVTKEDLFSEAQIFTSIDVIEKAIRYIQENNIQLNFKGKHLADTTASIGWIRNNLKTEIVPATKVIQVTFFDGDPNNAVTVLRALMKQYLLHRMQIYNPIDAEIFFSNQADSYLGSLDEKYDELTKLVVETKTADPLQEIRNNYIIKQDLEQQLISLNSESIENILYIQYLEETLDNKNMQFFSTIDNQAINGVAGLGPGLQSLIAEKRNILRIYHFSSEKAMAIEEQINETYSTLKNEVIAYKNSLSNQLQIIDEKIKNIEEKLSSISNRNVELKKQDILFKKIETESNLLLLSYETFSKRREEAKINNTVDETNLSSTVSVLSKAFTSGTPVFPKKIIIIPLGLIVGFIAGCSLSFLREYFDHTFKNPGDINNYTGLPVIFSIPK